MEYFMLPKAYRRITKLQSYSRAPYSILNLPSSPQSSPPTARYGAIRNPLESGRPGKLNRPLLRFEMQVYPPLRAFCDSAMDQQCQHSGEDSIRHVRVD
jgi:hypothetical protein